MGKRRDEVLRMAREGMRYVLRMAREGMRYVLRMGKRRDEVLGGQEKGGMRY
jgi:hypothetical protein